MGKKIWYSYYPCTFFFQLQWICSCIKIMKFSSFSSVLNFHCMSTQMVPWANNDTSVNQMLSMVLFLPPQRCNSWSAHFKLVDNWFNPQSDQTKVYRIAICSLSAKHAALRLVGSVRKIRKFVCPILTFLLQIKAIEISYEILIVLCS